MSEHEKKVIVADAVEEYSKLRSELAYRREKINGYLSLCRQIAQAAQPLGANADTALSCAGGKLRLLGGAYRNQVADLSGLLSEEDLRGLVCERDEIERKLKSAEEKIRGLGLNIL